MLQKHSKGLTVFVAALFILGTAFFAQQHAAAEATKEASDTSLLAAPASMTINVDEALEDRVLGKPEAPVTITEYASMTCSHCAHFNVKYMPEVKKQLIETGRAKLVYRDFPLDEYALRAAMMTRCIPKDKYYNLVEVIFTNQERWVQAKDPIAALAQLGALAGMDEAQFKACTSNKDLETAILKRMQDAQAKHEIKATPTFIFNDGADKLSGAQPVEEFEKIVNKLTKGK